MNNPDKWNEDLPHFLKQQFPLVYNRGTYSGATLHRSINCQQYLKRFYNDICSYPFLRQCRREDCLIDCERRNLTDKETADQLDLFFQKESAHLRLKRTKVKIADFQILEKIGQGGYGSVYLGRKRDTDEICVIKVLKKEDLLKINKENTLLEKDLMVKNSPWIIKLLYSFQDSQHLYLVMEYAPGGDFKTLLVDLGALYEHDAAFYIAEMFVAVNEIHKYGFIHRDLKPGNFVIDQDGHLKIIDFGLSKNGFSNRLQYFPLTSHENLQKRKDSLNPENEGESRNMIRKHNRPVSKGHKARSSLDNKTLRLQRARQINVNPIFDMVGSPNYMCPEMLAKKGYDLKADYWSLGCILFEMVAGYPPFIGETLDEIFHNIMNFQETLRKPDSEGDPSSAISNDCWNLIVKLLCPKEYRLDDIDQIQSEPFFRKYSINFKKLREYIPDYSPKNNEDALRENFISGCNLNLENINITEMKEYIAKRDPNYFPGYTYKAIPSTTNLRKLSNPTPFLDSLYQS